MRLTYRVLGAVLVFASAMALTAASARAAGRFHAHLVRADPAVNDTVAMSPKAVSLWFSEPVELALSKVRVVRVGGDTVKTGALRREGTMATTAALDFIGRATAPGTYVVTYHVVARDGHPTAGEYRFVVR